MALIDQVTGVCLVDDVDGDEWHAVFDDAELVFTPDAGTTTGRWMEPSEDGEAWEYTPMTPAQVREYLDGRGIVAFAC